MRRLAFIALLLASAVASAGILPLLRDRPRRDNVYDPTNKPMSLPLAPVWTPTPTNTATPACNPGVDAANVNTFESGTEGFAYETYAGPPPYQVLTLASTNAQACNGSKSLCGTVSWTHSGATTAKAAFKKNVASTNWSNKILSAWVYFPPSCGDSRAKLYIKVTAGYVGNFGTEVSAGATGGWKTITYNLAGIANANDVREYGLDMYSNSGEPDGPFTFCIDSIDVQ